MQQRTDNPNTVSRSGAIWNMLGSAMFGASSMLLLMFVNRSTDLATAGVFSIAFSTAQLLYLLGLFGANHFQMTDYEARYPFAAYRRLKLLSSLLMLLAGAAAALILRFDRTRILLTLLLTLYMMACSVGELYQSMFFQRNRLDLSGRSLFLRTLLATVAFSGVIAWTGSVYAAALALIAAALAGLWLFAARPARPFLAGAERKAERGSLPRLLLECLPLFVSVLLMDLIIVCPKYAVDHFLTDEATAVFSMILMPVQLINLFCSFVFRPSLRGIADAIFGRDRARLARTMRRMTWIVLGVTLLAAAAAWWIGPEALGLFYGAELTPYRTELLIVIAGSGAFAYTHLLYYVLIVLRKQRRLLVNYAVTAVLAVAGAYWLAGGYGMMGAIAAFVITQALLILLHARSLYAALRPIFTEENDHAV